MKITQSKLKQIIKEELRAVLNEGQFGYPDFDPYDYGDRDPVAAAADFKARQQKLVDDIKKEIEAAINDPNGETRKTEADYISIGGPCREAERKQKGSQEHKNYAKACREVFGPSYEWDRKLNEAKLIQVIREEIVNTLAELDESASPGANRRKQKRKQKRRKLDVARRKSPDTTSSSTPRTTDTGATPPSRTAAPSNVPQQKPLTPEEFDAIIAKHWANIGRNKEKDTSKEAK